MTSHAGRRTGWLSFWLLPADERSAVRHICASGRAAGDPQLDAIARRRLERAVRRTRWTPGRRPAVECAADPELRLARLCSSMRHPSRCRPVRATARTS